jgi:hypothetical protein
VSGYRAQDFHQACDGMGMCVVVVKAENGSIAAAYNEDGFTSVDFSSSLNKNGFITYVNWDGGCGEIYHRNSHDGIANKAASGPVFGSMLGGDLLISDNCHENQRSRSRLGMCYESEGMNQANALFGQENFRVVDYEVFKIVIE